ncbi:hypothetical protein LENED_001193 [Lentinula edodes]|uniref:Uncharacterized protein n=1 Tax=Lentinula edodes TaxID=5353 RepID=A0A1Q3DXR5_LENED|nr:hypothetical protein LENED_001193 [Lentinula edodes]
MNPRCKDITRFGHNNCFILRLPIELQTQIFIECASYPYGQLMIEHEVPQVLLLVCKYWRDLAYATSRLWSSFEIHFGTWEQNFKGTEGDARILSRVRLFARGNIISLPIRNVGASYATLLEVARHRAVDAKFLLRAPFKCRTCT